MSGEYIVIAHPMPFERGLRERPGNEASTSVVHFLDLAIDDIVQYHL